MVPVSKDSKSIAMLIGMQKALEPESGKLAVELGIGSKIDVTSFQDQVEYWMVERIGSIFLVVYPKTLVIGKGSLQVGIWIKAVMPRRSAR